MGRTNMHCSELWQVYCRVRDDELRKGLSIEITLRNTLGAVGAFMFCCHCSGQDEMRKQPRAQLAKLQQSQESWSQVCSAMTGEG